MTSALLSFRGMTGQPQGAPFIGGQPTTPRQFAIRHLGPPAQGQEVLLYPRELHLKGHRRADCGNHLCTLRVRFIMSPALAMAGFVGFSGACNASSASSMKYSR